MLDKDRRYISLIDEVKEQRVIIQKLRAMNRQLKSETTDIDRETMNKNIELVDIIREQAKELDFLGQVTKWMLKDEEL